jgi:hypothetical protein
VKHAFAWVEEVEYNSVVEDVGDVMHKIVDARAWPERTAISAEHNVTSEEFIWSCLRYVLTIDKLAQGC